MSNEDNLKLWNSVEKTNPNYTKKANVKGNSITSISPQYQVLNATERFGSYGIGWGFESLKFDYTLKELGLISLEAVFYYPSGSFPILNSISIWKDNAKTKLDDNFAKKLETDTLTKALSKLGFNADIFLGKFEDLRYMKELNDEFKTDEQKESEAKRDAYLAKQEADKLKSSKKTLTDKQFETMVNSRNKEHISISLKKYNMAEAQRKVLTTIKDAKDANAKT